MVPKNPRLDGPSLERLIQGIEAKVVARVDHVYLRLEDERLAYAAMSALRRDLIRESYLTTWTDHLGRLSAEAVWPDLIEGDQADVSAWHNTRDFLRSLFFQLTFTNNPPKLAGLVLANIKSALRAMDLGFYELR